jgi:septal ring factor EnvC (AmiA/AmiB activator)
MRRTQLVSKVLAGAVALAASAAVAAGEPTNPTEKLDQIQKQIGRDQLDIESLSKSAVELAQEQEQIRLQLIRAAAAARAREAELNTVEQRLALFETREAEGMRALIGKRGKLASLLAVLQRMGSEPPPALVVRPNDATGAARSAMLLTAVVPAVRREAATLQNDLVNLREMRQKAAEERLKVAGAAEALDRDRNVLSELLTQRRHLAAQMRDQLKATEARVGTLAAQAIDLRALIASLSEDAKRPMSQGAGQTVTTQIASAGAVRNTPFESLRGLLTLPANGELKSRFGAADGMGAHLAGIHLETRPGSQVTSPCDGKIAYAGPFRGYGKMLIIAANGGYHVLLAGLSKVDGTVGQVVLAGEPVGRMGTQGSGPGGERLYIEFRRNNVPVDPVPWFAAFRQKVSG